jgi:hypothetical protein
MKSKEIKVTLPGNIWAWFEYQAEKENRTLSGLALHCIIGYLGHRNGKNRYCIMHMTSTI